MRMLSAFAGEAIRAREHGRREEQQSINEGYVTDRAPRDRYRSH